MDYWVSFSFARPIFTAFKDEIHEKKFDRV